MLDSAAKNCTQITGQYSDCSLSIPWSAKTSMATREEQKGDILPKLKRAHIKPYTDKLTCATHCMCMMIKGEGHLVPLRHASLLT